MSQPGRRVKRPGRRMRAQPSRTDALRRLVTAEPVRSGLRSPSMPSLPSPVVGRRAHLYRARSLASTLGLTVLSTVLPGSGFLLAGRRALGLIVIAIGLVLLGLVGYAGTHQAEVLAFAVDPRMLLVTAIVLLALVVGLVGVVVLSYRMLRRRRAPQLDRVIEMALVFVLCLVVASPLAMGARYALVQRDLVTTVFAEGSGDDDADAAVAEEEGTSVWGKDERVNVLLLGGDGGVHRTGVRTDSVILASLDAETGNAVLFSLPRNLAEVPFPEGSELDEIYPNGFTGPGDPLQYMLNAVYGQVPALHPEAVEDAENPGAKAVKQAVSGALGMPVDYYALINLKGFQQVVDAIGGVTVNVNQPIPIGGNTDAGVPPKDYIEPGPSQHLNGFHALWFARGRYGLDDYDRMERQRCVMQALIDEADPMTVLRRYEELASAGKEIVRTDIPQALVPDFVELALELRKGDVDSLVFQYSDRFNPNDPNYEFMHNKVERVLAESFGSGTASASPAPPGSRGGADRGGSGSDSGGAKAGPDAPASPDASAEAAERDPCAYHPVG